MHTYSRACRISCKAPPTFHLLDELILIPIFLVNFLIHFAIPFRNRDANFAYEDYERYSLTVVLQINFSDFLIEINFFSHEGC